MTCEHCRRDRALDHFPLANPRADGSQHPMRFCDDCWSTIVRGGVRTAAQILNTQRENRRNSARRRRAAVA